MHHVSPKDTDILYTWKTRALSRLVQGKCTCVDFGLDPGEVDVVRRAERIGGVTRDGSASLGELTDFREGSKDSCKEKKN